MQVQPAFLEVTNTGKAAGRKSCNCISATASVRVTPAGERAQGFQKVWLEAGEKKRVTLEISPEALAFYDVDMNYVVEPGVFEIMVGNSSRVLRLAESCSDGSELILSLANGHCSMSPHPRPNIR